MTALFTFNIEIKTIQQKSFSKGKSLYSKGKYMDVIEPPERQPSI